MNEKNCKIKKIIDNPMLIVAKMGFDGLLNWMNDEKYLKVMYYALMNKKLDIDKPHTYTEKLQWLKVHDRRPIYSILVDKYEVKRYVGDVIGKQYVIPTLGVWDSFDEIEFDKLPNQFVLKCTHDSGGVFIVKDKEKLDKRQLKKKIDKCMKRNFFWWGREWPYKDVKPRIIAEKYLEDLSSYDLKDYKFFTFNGIPKIMFVATDRQAREETKFDFFDMNFSHLDIINGHPNAEVNITKPESFEMMKQLSEKLSAGIPQCRVDFYDVNGKVYFGEITFFHWSGFVPFEPERWDEIIGNWIKLPRDNIQ